MSPSEELNLLMRVATLEERLANAERLIHLFGPLLPQIEAGCAQAIQHALRLSADLQDRAKEQAAMWASNSQKLDELRECIESQEKTLKKIVDSCDNADWWKGGDESDS